MDGDEYGMDILKVQMIVVDGVSDVIYLAPEQIKQLQGFVFFSKDEYQLVWVP